MAFDGSNGIPKREEAEEPLPMRPAHEESVFDAEGITFSYALFLILVLLFMVVFVAPLYRLNRAIESVRNRRSR